jgi:hypothetical protein
MVGSAWIPSVSNTAGAEILQKIRDGSVERSGYLVHVPIQYYFRMDDPLKRNETGHSYIHSTQSNAILRREPLEDRRNDPNAFQTCYTGTHLPTTLQQLLYTARFRGGSIQPLRFYYDATAAQSPSSTFIIHPYAQD